MSNIVEADYTIIQERTLPVIISEIKIIEQHVTKTAIEGAIQIGERLQEAKDKIGHGNFGDWCKENLNYSQDTAQKFMKLAREYGDKNSMLANTAMSRNFSISNALSLLKVPEEDREQFVEEHQIEDMTNKDLEEEIRKLKKEKEELKHIAECRKGIIDRAESAANDLRYEAEDLKRKLQDAKTQAESDPEEMEKLQKKLRKAEESLKKEKEKLKKEQEDRQATIDKELKAAGERMQEQTKASIEGLQSEIEKLKKRQQNAGNESLLRFKVFVDQLQDAFSRAVECILDEEDQEQADKMNTALKAVLKNMEEDL